MRFWGLMGIFLLTSCAAYRGAHRSGAPSAKEASLREGIVQTAKEHLGAAYRSGGTTRAGFDCSGLVYRVYGDAGVRVARSTAEQIRQGRAVSMSQAKPGDLVFFRQKGKVNHVGIVERVRAGQLWVIHSSTSQGVIREDIRSSWYWSDKVDCIRSVIGS